MYVRLSFDHYLYVEDSIIFIVRKYSAPIYRITTYTRHCPNSYELGIQWTVYIVITSTVVRLVVSYREENIRNIWHIIL